MAHSLRRRTFLVQTAGAAFAVSSRAGFSSGAVASAGLGAASPGGVSRSTESPGLNDSNPFRRAVVEGDARLAGELLSRDPALLYSRDELGQSVYLLAAYAGKTEVMKLLESKGLVLDIYEACAGGKLDRVNELLRAAPGLMKIPNPAGDTPLHVAVLCGQSAMVDNTILQSDFTLRNPRRKNATAAHLGLQSANQLAAETVAFDMVGNALDPALATADGDTLLHCAARSGYPRVVRLLLQKGADPAARNAAGQTPLDIATTGGKAEAVELMRNASTIPRDYYARRYAYAAKFGTLQRDDTQGLPRDFVNTFVVVSHFSFERVKKWLELCPELLNTRAPWDELPVEAAAHMGRSDIGGHLLDRGAAYSLCTAAAFGSLDDVKRMLAGEPQRIHERGAHSFPLLWYTAFGKPRLEVAQYLISMGADPKEDMRGRTVLHTAASSGNAELCRFFIEQGLDPLQKGTNFMGTQDAIEAAQLAKHPEVAAMLRDWVKQKR